ncbi:DNA-directed RNA polymerase, omega subunit [Alkaliphilus metalliredigens QYMF]|uniref:DNA-directed RNA polymerase subunit omega n=1 Tax=Alkaliphilus metalliredigens (strain QYMF) TaxID=293826 RepID=RPOZ_ALKMQ|nr:DNA-directed RNA polymerase subunit omega [Alkaliphilus metalliredigens]A6TRX1.1 RecName: Full=DNA-directed RNA polymerase subunit omega; Short=RNAP omega subunit; AltName: Full=RNA polymerase omega subunit; AltName: Full=Transcriptase subunit omega [Alkaliphilus metalliredigens QYMF]ABR48939.1 DNA-directed RNA polymerase, omega subunit [Alkaliphilus metalliredigens QYMF]
MLKPSINELLTVVDSRYSLVVATAKRARQIIDGAKIKVDSDSNKPVSTAAKEIYEGKVTYIKTDEDER